MKDLLAGLLPGAYLALLGIGLAVALARWYDAVPRRALAVFALALGVLFGPALFAGRVLLSADLPLAAAPYRNTLEPRGNPLHGDLVLQITPSLAGVRRALAAGGWPLLDPAVGAGMPLLADPQAQVLQPLVWLAWPLPLASAIGVTAGLRALVALVFSFLFFRRQGLSEPPALFGALAYGLGGFLLLWLGWPLANTAARLPAILYALVLSADRGRRRDFALLAASLAALLAAGHPETELYAFAAAALPPARPGRRLPARSARSQLRVRLVPRAAARVRRAEICSPRLAYRELPIMKRATFADNVVIVTGASAGIGRELAVQLATQGARLALAARDGARLAEVAAECRQLGGQALAVPTDVADSVQCGALVAATVAAYGRVDTLINNAGISMWARFVDLHDLELFDRLLRVNYLGSVYCTHFALPHLLASRGRLVAVSSMTGRTGVPMRSGYAASKHAMTGFFDTLRIELAGTGVSVTVAYPDFVATEIRQRAFAVDGRPLGESPVRESEIMTAEVCARQIVAAAGARKREIVQSARGRVGLWLKVVAPGLVDRIARRAVERGK